MVAKLIPFATEQIIEFAKQQKGWTRESELEWLISKARTVQAIVNQFPVWVEIGSWMGRSAIATALALPAHSTFVSVEPFTGNEGSLVQPELKYSFKWVQWQLDLSRRMITHCRPDLTLEFLCMTSRDAAIEFVSKGRKADAVFIDGDHSFEAVHEDLQNWIPLIPDNGLLCGHDRQHKGVKQALKAMKVPVYDGAGAMWEWNLERMRACGRS